MEKRLDNYLQALREIYKETHNSHGGSFSMATLLRKHKVPTQLSLVLQEEKLIRKTGTTKDVRYFWAAPVIPNLKMAEIAMDKVIAKTGGIPVNKKEEPVVMKKQEVKQPIVQEVRVEQPRVSDCKPLEFRVSFLFGLFKYEKIVN